MKKKYTFTWPKEAFYLCLAVGIVYGWKVGILSYLGIGLIYTLGGGK